MCAEDLTGSLALGVGCVLNETASSRSVGPEPAGGVRTEEFGESNVLLGLRAHRSNRNRTRHVVRTCRFYSVAMTGVPQRVAECHRVLSPSRTFVGNRLEACTTAHVLGWLPTNREGDVGFTALVSRPPLLGAVSEGLVMRGSGTTVRETAIRGRATGTDGSPTAKDPSLTR
jgi:hypothetical protein